MKKLALFLFGSILLFSCEKATQFEVDYNTELVVEANSPISDPFDVVSPEVTTNAKSKFEANNTTKEHIEKVTLEDLDLSIISPSDQNFDFLKSVELYINADGLSELRIAHKNSVPEGQKEISLETVDNDLQEYIKSDSFTLRVKTVTDETFTEDVHINVYSNFFVDAKIVK